ncbi:MAG TPA: prepilin peptidase [Polyangiaceae bacterium]|nr:prepilin peptidase [Polyangiaceae bacterium]
MLPFLCATLILCFVSTITDLRSARIPNWLTLGGAALGLIGHGALGWSWGGYPALGEALAGSLSGGLLCGLVPLVLYLKGGLGGGDLKLFVAIGVLCRPLLGIEIQTYGLVTAAVIAPARLAYEGRLLRVALGSLQLATDMFRPKERRRAPPPELLASFRLAPAVLVGALLSLIHHSYELLPR